MDMDLDQREDGVVATEEVPATVYYVDQNWYETNGLSLQEIMQSRMCDTCQKRAAAGEEEEERYTAIDPKTRRTSFQVRRVPFARNPMKRIRDCCSSKKGYIHPDMATLEAVFRIYLAEANQPMPLSHVRERLVDWCPDGQCRWLLLSDGQLERIVANDAYYGIRPFQAPIAS
jgi:hypothetical protein